MADSIQLLHFDARGWAMLAGIYTPEEQEALAAFTNELEGWPDSPGKWLRYHERSGNGKVLARIENFVPFHPQLAALLLSERIYRLAALALGEPALLFKDKINFRFSGTRGFALHQDLHSYLPFGIRRVVTVMVPVDDFTEENGCLEFAAVSSRIIDLLPYEADRNISKLVEAEFSFQSLLAHRGDVVIFDALAPHRSSDNRSDQPRRAFFMTFNAESEGDRRSRYYEEKRVLFPPEAERAVGRDYTSTGSLFNLGNSYD